MKTTNIILNLGLAAGLATLAGCGSGDTNNGDSAPAVSAEGAGGSETAPTSGDTDTHSASGTVDSVSGSEVTISHDPIKTLDWPAMSMTFTAQDAALLNGIKKGDRVSFAFTKTESASTLTSISKQ